jgi:hypothetical protein
MTSNDKHYYLTKKTLAIRLLKAWKYDDLQGLAYFDELIGKVYDANKKEFEKYKDRMKKLTELYNEFKVNPRQFVEKYATMDNNQNVLRILKENPKLFRNE